MTEPSNTPPVVGHRKDSGIPKGIVYWVRNNRPQNASVYVLAAVGPTMELETVARWEGSEVQASYTEWANTVCATATEDAANRGVTTQYELIHEVDSRTLAKTKLRRVRDGDGDDLGHLDGSLSSQLRQSQVHTEFAFRSLLEMAKNVMQMQGGMLAVLSSSHGQIAKLQEQNFDLHEALAKNGAKSSAESAAFGKLIDAVGPELAVGVMQKLGLSPTDDPKPTTTTESTTPPEAQESLFAKRKRG